MKILLLLLLASSLLLSSCASDPADRDFFERGWLRPGKRDFSLSHG